MSGRGRHSGVSGAGGARPARGFTLVELMIAVGIVGLLASVAVPLLTRATLRSRAAERLTIMRAIADAILEGMSAAKHKVWHAEGYEVRSWILLDYVQVVVHIFLPETRSYYALENQPAALKELRESIALDPNNAAAHYFLGAVLFTRRELPEAAELDTAIHLDELGRFRHSIMNRNYIITVVLARVQKRSKDYRWVSKEELELIPLATTARKALLRWNKARGLPVNS